MVDLVMTSEEGRRIADAKGLDASQMQGCCMLKGLQ